MKEEMVSLIQETKSRWRRGYIKEFKDELKKVSWTSMEELRLSTKIVVGATFFFGLAIYLVDLAIQGSLNGLHALVFKVIG